MPKVEEEVSAQELVEIQAQELANIEAEMELAAKAMQESLEVSTSRISNAGKQFTLPDGTVIGPKLECVILGYVDASALYPPNFDPNNIEPPICYAVGKAGEPLVPNTKVEKPEAEKCSECPNDEYGSAAVGQGKACKNEYQVAVVVPGHTETPITLCISATGRKPFNSSMSAILKNFGHPTRAIVTAEFTDKAFPVVKITGGVPNPDAAKHFSIAADAIQDLLDQ